MNTNIIEARKHITFIGTLDDTGEILFDNIYVPFTPDDMIIKSVLYYSTADETAIESTSVLCNFVRDSSEAICTFFNSVNYSPNSNFKVIIPFPNSIKFTILDNDSHLEITRTGVLSIHCEFVKYKDMKQEKIY